MQKPAALAKNDHLLGICRAIGQDFGFDPTWLRAVFALMLLVNFKVALIGYGVAGFAVLASRLLVRPKRSRARIVASSEQALAAEETKAGETPALAVAA